MATSAFEQQLKRVLKYFDDPQQIGEASPLASPYFLSHALQNVAQAHLPSVRGQVLCNTIRQAAAALWGEGLPKSLDEIRAALTVVRQMPGTPRYAYIVLELRCFQQFLKPQRTAEIWEHDHYLPGSQAEHYRDFDAAVSLLGDKLLDHLHPTLRPEYPPPPPLLLGYAAYLEQALTALRAGKSVHLCGPGGIGKTSLGATIFGQLTPAPVFWYTFRPTLNDRIGSLLFSLGHFLHAYKASNLWQLVVAAGGIIEDYQLALALLRQDIALLAPHPPVLCFDEIDRLYSTDAEQASLGYTQLIAFLEGLRGLTPLLLISQKATIETDLYLTPAGLAAPQIQALFQQAGCPLEREQAQQLQRYTGGNPRLLVLCLALHQTGEPLIEQLARGTQSPALAVLVHRLWQRLDSRERQLLQRLAVFRSPAPVASWPEAQAQVQSIVKQRLATLDSQGGIELLPALRGQLYQELSPDLREQLHLAAAEIRLAYGQTTAAAYHYWQGNRNAKAVQAWYPRLAQEILRGQGDAAFAIFSNISRYGLGKAEVKALTLIQAELTKLQGNLVQGRAIIESQDWTTESESSVRARLLQGEFLDALGYPDSALQSYGDGVVTAARLLGKVVLLHRWRSILQVRQKELQLAWREAQLAECQLHNLHGFLEFTEGRYPAALLSLQKALALAEILADAPSLALTERNLANLYGRQQNIPQAQSHADRALEHYQRTGDRYGLAIMLGSLASIYLDNHQFAQAAQLAAQALAGSKAFPYFAAIAATNLAEALFELGEWERAQKHAYDVLTYEERQTFPYALFTLGRIKLQQNALAAAEQHFVEAIRIAQANRDPFIAAYVQRELGNLYHAQGLTEKAHPQWQAALHFFEDAGLTAEAEATRQLLVTALAM